MTASYPQEGSFAGGKPISCQGYLQRVVESGCCCRRAPCLVYIKYKFTSIKKKPSIARLLFLFHDKYTKKEKCHKGGHFSDGPYRFEGGWYSPISHQGCSSRVSLVPVWGRSPLNLVQLMAIIQQSVFPGQWEPVPKY